MMDKKKRFIKVMAVLASIVLLGQAALTAGSEVTYASSVAQGDGAAVTGTDTADDKLQEDTDSKTSDAVEENGTENGGDDQDEDTVDIYVYLNFYDESLGDPDDIIAFTSATMTGYIMDDVIKSQINPYPWFYEFDSYDDWPRVYLNYSALDIEEDITDECSYDSNTGIITIPASYAGESITVKSVMGDESYAYVNLVDDEFKYPLVDDDSMYADYVLTDEDYERIQAVMKEGISTMSWEDYETIAEPDQWKDHTGVWQCVVNDTFTRDYNPDDYTKGQVIQCSTALVSYLTTKTDFANYNMSDYYNFDDGFGFAVMIRCDDPIFDKIGRSNSCSTKETWKWSWNGSSTTSTSTWAISKWNWLFGQCVQRISNSSTAGHNPVSQDAKILITNIASDGTMTCFLKVWTSGWATTDTSNGAQNVGLYFRVKPSSGTEPPNRLPTTYKARDAYSPSMDIYIEKTDANTGNALAGAEFDVYMDGKKVDTVTTGSDGRTVYHWRGSTLYTDYASSTSYYVTNYDKLSSTDKASLKGNTYASLADAFNHSYSLVISSLATAMDNLKAQTHTWKVVETKAPAGYETPSTPLTWEQTLDLETVAVEVDFTNVSNGGFLKLVKTSANEDLTAGNDSYSLEGAEYGVYKSESNAQSDSNRIATLTTKADGSTNTVELDAGDYFVKEITASKGYLLCDGSDESGNGIHTVEVTAENTEDNPATVTCKEPVGNDPFSLALYKMDAETGNETSLGTATLEGAVFELAYYTNTTGSTSGDPFKTWYFVTDEDGYLDCNSNTLSYLISSCTTNEGEKLISDDLYVDDNGNVTYLIGTYVFREVIPPTGYQNAGTMKFVADTGDGTDVTTGLKAIIKQPSTGTEPKIYYGSGKITGEIKAENLAINVYDEPYRGSITVNKKGEDGTTPLEGVSFELVGEDGSKYTGTTDAKGTIVWDDLIPQDYTLTETSTVDGMTLLAESVEITLPVSLTKANAKLQGVNTSEAVWDEANQCYRFYDITYTITNEPEFDLPRTGGIQPWYLMLIMAGGLAAGLVVLFRKRKTA